MEDRKQEVAALLKESAFLPADQVEVKVVNRSPSKRVLYGLMEEEN